MHNIDNSMEDRIAARINAEIGKDFTRLKEARLLAHHYKEQLDTIGKELNYEDQPESLIPPQVPIYKSAFDQHQRTIVSNNFKIEKLTRFNKRLQKKIEETTKAINSVRDDLNKVRYLQRTVQYLRFIKDIQEINAALKNGINGKDEAKLINTYLTLYEENDCEHSVIGRLSVINAKNLNSFALRTATYWHTTLMQRFSNEFETVLKNMRWARKELSALNASPTRDTVKAQLLAEYLFLLKSPVENTEKLDSITLCIVCQPISQVSKLLLAPYRQRFMFHFTGTKQTNRLDKPEWFYTQILNWGKESHLFVGKIFQPSAVNAGKLDFNIRLEFMRGLVQLTIEKLATDIEQIAGNENLFAHLIDETLAFESDLRETFGYPSSFPSAIAVLTQPMYLLKWVALEERFCAEKMDGILHGDNPWQVIDPNIFDDDLKIPKCVDQFMRLLDTIKDRYCSLIQPGHQLQFLFLQIELIDSFRRRLVQLHSNGVVSSIPILNAINYITMVLREWGENVHYLHLNVALGGPNASEIDSVFANSVKDFEHWTDELLSSLATKGINEVKAKSRNYKRDIWSTMPEQNSHEPFILSTSAGELFQVLVTLLHNLQRELSANLFNEILRLLAHQIDEYMLDSMVLNTRFSPAGAEQFNYDMTRNLFPLFGQYTSRPDLLFKKIHDASKLLNTARGTALLLLENLQADQPLEVKLIPLKELGLLSLKPRACIDVLQRRTDIKTF